MCKESKNSVEKCCSGVNVSVDVNVAKIVKYMCIASVLIIGIIFGTKCAQALLKSTKEKLD